MTLRAYAYLVVCSSLVLLTACAATTPPPKTAQASFNDGETALAAHRYEVAIAEFKKVRESYSSPELSTQAELKIADAHFDNKAYIEAAAAYDDFRKLHPSNDKLPYAMYRLALSHYNQITGIDTDQTPVKNAVAAFENFLNRYPDSPYAPEARQKLADCKAKQLDYENYVGNFYLRTGKYGSAIKRLNEALLRFANLPKLDQTLFYLAKAYQESGDKEQARKTLKRLETEFPQSPLNREAAKLKLGFAGSSSPRG
ncbi:outer membrane protein assembly factor BamD [Geomonas limicola]|uniref:Outer membrane protein assembly factor BamD n=1 Tax=Geomonas limicola TaxID=2740186 RepID=A0A6V8N8H2_9BACT|nr:outer membrane protein assembly factor BamD [Geomonas limicola]GFO68882.1 outer membrane protein assembly factor BamD [Geomonas limicola]